MSDNGVAPVRGISHVRLTVTDITRSKEFYRSLLGKDPAFDFSDQVAEPGATEDPSRLYGGCVFQIGDQILGLRPVARAGDRFDSTRVGLDHVSLLVDSVDVLREAGRRLDALGIEHGAVNELSEMGLAILSIQDPDDVNLELSAPM